MSEFTVVVQALAKNNEEERQRDSNMNQNIAFQSEQTHNTIQNMALSITESLEGTKDSLVDAGEATTDAVNLTAPKPDGGAEEEEKNRQQNLFKRTV